MCTSIDRKKVTQNETANLLSRHAAEPYRVREWAQTPPVS